jgi:S-adenosylmethionine hydrolase
MSERMNELSGIISLTTDFGLQDPFVGVMKGVILRHAPASRIVDLTHGIHPHWPVEAGFWLHRSYQYFPKGTVHVAVVDPGVGTDRHIIAVAAGGHFFCAPDNGLLTPILGLPGARIFRLSDSWLAQQNWPATGNTFQGRDIFAPLAAELSSGQLGIDEIGPETSEYSLGPTELPELSNGIAHGSIITIDHFGNLITNLDQSLIQQLHAPVVSAGGRTFQLARTYGSASPGDYLAILNSFNVLEISRVQGNAAESLGLGRGSPVTVQESALGH